MSKDKKILKMLLCEAVAGRPIFWDDIHDKIYLFSKENKLDANKVGKVVKKILKANVEKSFKQDFSKKPKKRFEGAH